MVAVGILHVSRNATEVSNQYSRQALLVPEVKQGKINRCKFSLHFLYSLYSQTHFFSFINVKRSSSDISRMIPTDGSCIPKRPSCYFRRTTMK